MRLNASILAFLSCLATSSIAQGELSFGEAHPVAGAGLSMPVFSRQAPLPLEMPRAESYIVSRGEAQHVVDRYNLADLWTSRTVRGRWADPEGRILAIARLDTALPYGSAADAMTRADYYAFAKSIDRENISSRDAAAKALAPASAADVLPPVRPRRSRRRNFREIVEYPLNAPDGTPAPALAWAFRLKNPDKNAWDGWFLATLELLPSDSLDSARAIWEADFLDRISPAPLEEQPPCVSESDFLFRDRAMSVAAYPEWSATRSGDFSILDNLQDRGSFAATLVEELSAMRRAYAAAAPSPNNVTNSIAAIRVFKTKSEYLDYTGEEYSWTAGVWDPLRRELAAWLPEDGSGKLLSTLRHEAFHQYLSSAAELATASPWFNEGHAELFESSRVSSGAVEILPNNDYLAIIRPRAKELAPILSEILAMDYDAFYSGPPEEVELKYALAWSIAYFLEKGAPLMRNRPFEGLRENYMASLVSTRSRSAATAAVFPADTLERFTAAWLEFYEIK